MNAPVPLIEARNEMRRLMAILMRQGKAYQARELELRRLHASGRQNYSGDIGSVLRNDLLLSDHSGASKTCATLITGIGAYIQAELALEDRQKRTGLTPQEFPR